MQHYTIAAIFFGVIATLLMCRTSLASVISCPPNNPQETSPALRQLCFAIEQVISENAPSLEQENVAQRVGYRMSDKGDLDNSSGNAKRQDVDHVFLRFGRRFGF